MAHMGVAVFGNKVFVTGGRDSSSQYLFGWDDDTTVYNKAYMFTAHDNAIKELSPMHSSRSHHGFVSYGGDLWAVGGTDGKKALDSVESLDPTTFKWKKRPHLI